MSNDEFTVILLAIACILFAIVFVGLFVYIQRLREKEIFELPPDYKIRERNKK